MPSAANEGENGAQLAPGFFQQWEMKNGLRLSFEAALLACSFSTNWSNLLLPPSVTLETVVRYACLSDFPVSMSLRRGRRVSFSLQTYHGLHSS